MKRNVVSIVLLMFLAVAANAADCVNIATLDDLKTFRDKVNAGQTSLCAVLTKDISASTTWTPIGTEAHPFAGSFDGQGHVVKKLSFAKNSLIIGLFGYVSGASIKNVGLEDCNFVESGSNVEDNVGSVVAIVVKNSKVTTLDNCYNTSTVTGFVNVGGLVGYVASGASIRMTNCYNSGNVTAKKFVLWIGAVDWGEHIAGGLIGSADGSVSIENCLNAGTVNSSHGWLIGGSEAEDPFVVSSNDENVEIAHSYYVSDSGSSEECVDRCPVTQDQITNGAVASALHDYYNEETGVSGAVWSTEGTGMSSVALELVWSSASDCVNLKEKSFSSVAIAEGQMFYANGVIYSGALTSAQLAQIGANSLCPISGVTLQNGVATLDATTQTPVIVPEGFASSSVNLVRSFNVNSFGTLMLPFSATVSGSELYEFKGVYKKEDGEWTAEVSPVGSTLQAHTPYLIVPSTSSLTFQNPVWSTTVNATTSAVEGKWTFRGTYEYVKWTEDEVAPGNIYGFSAEAKENISIGEFVKAAYGAYIKPMRAFLEYHPASQRPAANGARMSIDSSLPESIKIVVREENGSTMSIGRLNSVTGEITTDRWFDAKGRALKGKPTIKGTYFNNGHTVIIR